MADDLGLPKALFAPQPAKMQSEALQARWDALRQRFEERREARQAAQEAAQEVRAAYTAAARRHAAEHAAAAAAAAAESHAAASQGGYPDAWRTGGGAGNGGQENALQPPLASLPPSRRPGGPGPQRSQGQPVSGVQGGGSRRGRANGTLSAAQAAAAALGYDERPVGRRRGAVTPLSLALSLVTFMVSRALVGSVCFVAGVAYADALQGDRGQRQRALRSLHRTTLRLVHRLHARGAPLLHALTQRCTLWWGQLQQWVASLAAGAIPVITALGTSVRASLAPPPASNTPARKSKGRGRRHVDVYAAAEEDEEEELAEDGLEGSSPDDGHQLHGMPVRRAPHVAGLLPSPDDVMLRSSYGDLTGTLSPRSVEDAPVAPPLRGASSLGPGPQSPTLAAQAGDAGVVGGDHPDLATQAEALSRAVRAAAARQAALDAAQTQLMLREMHSPGGGSVGAPAGGASPLSVETTSSLRAIMQNDAARAATAPVAPRQTSIAAGGEYNSASSSIQARVSTPGLGADEEVFAREAAAQKQRADAQAAVLAARARLAEVVAMTQRSASSMES